MKNFPGGKKLMPVHMMFILMAYADDFCYCIIWEWHALLDGQNT